MGNTEGNAKRNSISTLSRETEISVAAVTSSDFRETRRTLLAWIDKKEHAAKSERGECAALRRSLESAKLSTRNLRRIELRIERRLSFLDKLRSAINEGYAIIPNFPLDVFAIRTARKRPRRKRSVSRYQTPGIDAASSESPPLGVGSTVSAFPLCETESFDGDDGKARYFSIPVEWNPDVDFPLAGIKPIVVDSIGDAIKTGIFDEYGITYGEGGDPIACARVFDTSRGRRPITFFLGWYLSPEDLFGRL